MSGADEVAAPQVGVGDPVQECGDSLVGFLGGFGQVPGVPLRLIGEPGGELGVGPAALLAGRQLDDRRPDQRVAERELFGGLVGAHDAGAFRGGQAFSPRSAAIARMRRRSPVPSRAARSSSS